jgi:uncharacterized protein
MQNFPYLGFGLGLRPTHYQSILDTQPKIDWFEIITEDFLVPGGRPLHFLNLIREQYPIVMHGVSLSVGGIDPLNLDYLQQVKNLAERINPIWISDHFCWTGAHGINLHDLLPLPYTEEAVTHVAQRVSQVQDFLGRQILLENVSSYVSYEHSTMTEWEFLTAVSERADCYLLFDVNNIYVSSFNHNFNPLDFIRGVPAHRVKQFHLAGHTHCGSHIVDTHDETIIEEVWKLYEKALQQFGPISTLIERDDNIPPLEELVMEVDQARTLAQKVLGIAKATNPATEVA